MEINLKSHGLLVTINELFDKVEIEVKELVDNTMSLLSQALTLASLHNGKPSK